MSKFIKTLAVISIFLLALCSGLLVSCDTEEDNSASYEEARKREKEVAEWTKLESIGYSVEGMNSHGDIAVRDSGTEGGIPRHYSDSTKQYAVIYFEAIPDDYYKFDFDGLTVTTEPASTDFNYELYTEKTNYFKVKVPIETTKVVINKSNAFVQIF